MAGVPAMESVALATSSMAVVTAIDRGLDGRYGHRVFILLVDLNDQ